MRLFKFMDHENSRNGFPHSEISDRFFSRLAIRLRHFVKYKFSNYNNPIKKTIKAVGNPTTGFTLIEVLIIAGISIFLTISLLNSSIFRTRINFDETARTVIADIRLAQANSLASKQFKNPSTGLLENRCGYGIYWQNTTSYYLYTGRVPPSCSPHQFSNNSVDVVITRVLDPRLEILNPTTGAQCSAYGMPPSDCPNFKDIFFESPHGKMWIGNQANPSNDSNNRSQILIRKIGATCPSSDCIYICVYSFGRIEQRTNACPKLTGP